MLLALLLGLGALPAGAQVVRAIGDNWCPYNCPSTDKQQGYLVDLLRATLGPDYRVDYRTEPWTRAIEQVASGADDILIATTPETTPGLWLSAPVGIDRTCFFTLTGRVWRFGSLADLDAVRIGVVQDYKYDADGPLDKRIATHGANVEVAFGNDALRSNFRKLLAGRMDVVVENENVGAFTLRQLGLGTRVRNAGCLGHYQGTLHFAVSRHRPDARRIVERIDRGVAELRRRGALATLLGRYGVDDWAVHLPARKH